MEGSDGSPPQSLCMIRAAELFPKSQMEKEDRKLMVPFQELAGESVKYLGRTDDGVLALSNYRIFLLNNSINSETSVPLGLIEFAQTRDLFHLIINCKDASTVKCSFETAEQCSEWQRRIQLTVGVPESLESLFAFPFYSWTCDNIANASGAGGESDDYCERLQRRTLRYEDDFEREVERLGFDLNGSWRISLANSDFKLCPSYPQKILVPCCISDEQLQAVANFRGSRRLPAVVWRHRKSGAVIARCSQPEVGWLGWRNDKDEKLLKAIADACAFDRGEQIRKITKQLTTTTTTRTTATSNSAAANGVPLPSTEADSLASSPDESHEEVMLDVVRKVLIVDARSYTSAVTNRARGGGCECIEYYPCAEIEFMNLGNIHVIRKSFHALRQLCASPPDSPNWLSMLEKTMWLQHLSGLLAASVTVCHAIEKKGRPVLVHCSDGWDRTPQIVATAQLCLDSYYRTVEGFRVLVEREWLNYGHKFADRCGHGPGSDDQNERCPVFLQWLDLVHQIHKQFTCSFEFSIGYLIKLAQHSLSCLFGTFLCNTLKERTDNSVFERTFSVWPFLSGPMYRNPLYDANREKVLWPAYNLRDMKFWTEVYLGSLGNKNCADISRHNADGLQCSTATVPMAKTRSYGDFITSGIIVNGISRRSSDPNMAVDQNLTIDSNSENNSMADTHSEREESPRFVANLINDTTRKLQNLTLELQNHADDEEIYKKNGDKRPKIHSLLEYKTENSFIETTIRNDRSANDQQQRSENDQEQENATNIERNINRIKLNSSPSSLNIYTFGCDFNIHENGAAELPSLDCAISSSSVVQLPTTTSGLTTPPILSTVDDEQRNFNGLIDDMTNQLVTTNYNETSNFKRTLTDDQIIDFQLQPDHINVDLMQSVDLSEHITTPYVESVFRNDRTTNSDVCDGCSIDTSTDTLVSTEMTKMTHNSYMTTDEDDAVHDRSEEDDKDLPLISRNMHEVNCYINEWNECGASSNELITSISIPSESQPSIFPSCNYSNYKEIAKNNNDASIISSNTVNSNSNNNNSSNETTPALNLMEESILILPEHKKLEISIDGECETIMNNIVFGTTGGTVVKYFDSTIRPLPPLPTAIVTTTTTTTSMPPSSFPVYNTLTGRRRRRTSSSNSRRDCFSATKPVISGSNTTSRFSVPGGVRSLPLTPSGPLDRGQMAYISCPDGLAHALSEQNIRLQQIVHEHKLREDVLLREIHDMRMALLRKTCPNCNNVTALNDEQCSALDNNENASICSWEAVEDRSGPSSCTSSSIQPIASSVLWVPDHAVSRCTCCQTEFWLGRRKHHCRSCGQIFCADCSEFWAPLPDEKLFNPVRLCGPCYHSVTTRMQRYKRPNNNSSNSIAANDDAVAANALTLKTLSALALTQNKSEAQKSSGAADKTKIDGCCNNMRVAPATIIATSVAATLNGSNINAANAEKMTMMSTKSAAAITATCCTHAATMAGSCQQQQQQCTAAMKAAAATN